MRLELPAAVADLLDDLVRDGHDAALVGGCVRDIVRGQPPGDWDVGTSAPPERLVELFPGSKLENAFGTVTIRASGLHVQVTPYRSESGYADHRRPNSVSFGRDIETDLARRDFTINAMAWRPAPRGDPGPGGSAREGELLDPHGGRTDLEARVLRAVGDPDVRFGEDALRLLRAVRFATLLELDIEGRTRKAIEHRVTDARHLSGERVRDELTRILRATSVAPSGAFRLMERLGLLEVLLPELAALRGIPQSKAVEGDALDHSLGALDALPATDPVLRLAGLLHDLGKATTLTDGHFIGHEVVGAELASALMRRLRYSRGEIERVEHLVRHHMFAYTPEWTDAAVRRFVRRMGAARLADLFALRRADNEASGVVEPQRGGLSDLAARAEAELRDGALETGQLAVRGDDLIAELGLSPGPVVGRLLQVLLEAVLEEPAHNERNTLLALARRELARTKS